MGMESNKILKLAKVSLQLIDVIDISVDEEVPADKTNILLIDADHKLSKIKVIR
jgi:hypothetical protein